MSGRDPLHESHQCWSAVAWKSDRRLRRRHNHHRGREQEAQGPPTRHDAPAAHQAALAESRFREEIAAGAAEAEGGVTFEDQATTLKGTP